MDSNKTSLFVGRRIHAVDKKVKRSFFLALKRDFKRNYNLYIMISPVIIFYLIFNYKPMYGAIIAFKNYVPSKGV